MIRIRKVKRIAIAVKDMHKAVENWKKLFGIRPLYYGEEPEDKYEYTAFNIGYGDTNIEFLAPKDDPNGEKMIGKFIKERGEGLYMITLETEGTSEEVDKEFETTGIKSAWGGMLKHWALTDKDLRDKGGLKSWTEHYVHPRDANGVLVTLASCIYNDEAWESKAGVTVDKL